MFASVYVTFYGYEERTRIVMLLGVNVLILLLQVYIQPCSIRSINVMRTASFTSSTWAALSSAL